MQTMQETHYGYRRIEILFYRAVVRWWMAATRRTKWIFVEVDDMRCPICDKEMEIGKLRSRGGVYFLPDGEKSPMLYTRKAMSKHRAILLPPFVSFAASPEYPNAYVCRQCKKLIMDIEE